MNGSADAPMNERNPNAASMDKTMVGAKRCEKKFAGGTRRGLLSVAGSASAPSGKETSGNPFAAASAARVCFSDSVNVSLLMSTRLSSLCGHGISAILFFASSPRERKASTAVETVLCVTDSAAGLLRANTPPDFKCRRYERNASFVYAYTGESVLNGSIPYVLLFALRMTS